MNADIIQERLFDLIKKETIPSTILLSGPKNCGKKRVAYHFATQLLATEKTVENHPDVHLYFPDEKSGLHSLESLRKLSHDVGLAPFCAQWKIFIIHEAEKMLPTSSNALLKTLEEPAAQTVIILLSQHPERLISTLISRCFRLNFTSHSSIEIPPPLLTLLSHGWQAKQGELLENEDPDIIFEAIFCWYRDRLALELKNNFNELIFPQHRHLIQHTPLIPLEHIEKRIKIARLAYERSTKLTLCLEMLFLNCRINETFNQCLKILF